MSKKILVIGGTRLFGVRLVQRLVDRGDEVTIATRGRVTDPFGGRVRRIVVDRSDRPAMRAAFRDAAYDVVFDQVCYSASDAELACEVFGDRVGRYVMASTIEVYRPCYGRHARPFVEPDADLDGAASQPCDDAYAAGKRQAEQVFAQASVPVARVRIGHVLAGPEDFTERLASYIRRVLDGAPLRHTPDAAPTSFIGVEAISALLCWAGDAAFVGAVNAASHAWSVLELHHRVARVLGARAITEAVSAPAAPAQLSPFDYAHPYAMDTERLRALGYETVTDAQWLDDAIRRHATRLAA
jgi:nucleoside-diphosphate-sugar epimerase